MRYHLYIQKLLVLRLLLLITAYTVCRFLFYVFNTDYFTQELSNLLFAFVAGVRFDISAILYTNIIFILLHILPGSWKSNKQVQKTAFILFLTINSAFLAINYIDIKYYSFINKRSTWDLLLLIKSSNDMWELMPTFILGYWYILLLWLLTTYGLWKLYPKSKATFSKTIDKKKSLILQTTLLLVSLVIITIGARGGLQMRPINLLTAAQYQPTDKVALVTNSTFTLINTYNTNGCQPVEYFPENRLAAIYTPIKSYGTTNSPTDKKNVVILILESFSAEYSQLLSGNHHGYTPFLDSLMRMSQYYTRAYANGKKSIESLPAILSGIPALMDNPYITGPYSANKQLSLPQVLTDNGYQTFFFHGGKNGTMSFDIFTKAAGISNYVGKNEYRGLESDFDGHWGIFDEPFLQYTAKCLDTVHSPFFAAIFTLSSHHPYRIPDSYVDQFPKGEHQILEAIGYADYALRQFFERVAKSEWYNNTLFVLTADHTAQSYTPAFSNSHGNYRIPMIFFDPSNTRLSGAMAHVVQQTDIFSSIIAYLNINTPILTYGNSVFGRNTGWALSYLNNVYQIVTDSTLIRFDGEKLVGFYRLDNDPLLEQNLADSRNKSDLYELNLLKAVIQDFKSRLINNKLTPE